MPDEIGLSCQSGKGFAECAPERPLSPFLSHVRLRLAKIVTLGNFVNAATHDFGEGSAIAARARLDIKAYELWTRCHEDGRVPSQQQLLGHDDCDFVDHSVLIKFRRDDTTPTISHIGTQLWLGLDGLLPQDIDEVPARSVLSRITEHYLEAVANRTAVGFEAEFVNEDGSAIGYRAIALPCATDGKHIDAVLGVVDYSMVGEAAGGEAAAPHPSAGPQDGAIDPSTGQGDMPKEGWRSVIAKMRRGPGEPVADEAVADESEPAAQAPVVQAADAEPPPLAPKKPRKRQALDPLPEPAADISQPAAGGRSAQSAVIAAALDQLLAIDGALAAALVELDSGMPLASAGVPDGIDLDIAVAGNTEVLRAKYRALRALGIEQRVEDIMITLPAQYHLLRPLSCDDGLFLCLVIDSGSATLGMARHELRRVERGLVL